MGVEGATWVREINLNCEARLLLRSDYHIGDTGLQKDEISVTTEFIQRFSNFD